MSGKQREMKGKQRGTERDMTVAEMKTSAGRMTGKKSGKNQSARRCTGRRRQFSRAVPTQWKCGQGSIASSIFSGLLVFHSGSGRNKFAENLSVGAKVDETLSWAEKQASGRDRFNFAERAEVSLRLVFRHGFGEVRDVEVTLASADVGTDTKQHA